MANEIQEQTGFNHSLQERQSKRQWILGRVATLLSHYWRDDDPSELTEAIARDWADILEGIPNEIIHRACLRYMRNEPRRKPTPGAIYAMCRDAMPGPAIVHHYVTDPRPQPERVSPEAANEMVARHGFAIKRMSKGLDE